VITYRLLRRVGGAATQIVKALAAKEGRELRSHSELWAYIDELAEKLNNRELRRLWRTANSLHQNFYEGWMPSRDVIYALEDVKEFIKMLRKYL
jgi:xylose isomerase